MALHDDKSIWRRSNYRPMARQPVRLDQLFTRILEVIAATTILLCLAPILLISSVAIRLDLADLFSSERRDAISGIDLFRYLDFGWLLPHARGEGSPRLTRVGLIDSSKPGINELPQFFNVLRGDVSFIEAFKSLL